jgi:hypothetical protein
MAEVLKSDPEKSEQDKIDILSKLKELREWNGDISEERMSSTSEDTHYKVRKNWFASVLALTELADEWHLLGEDLSSRFRKLSEKYCNEDFRLRDTTAQDIEEIDKFLREVIGKLEGNQNGRV